MKKVCALLGVLGVSAAVSSQAFAFLPNPNQVKKMAHLPGEHVLRPDLSAPANWDAKDAAMAPQEFDAITGAIRYLREFDRDYRLNLRSSNLEQQAARIAEALRVSLGMENVSLTLQRASTLVDKEHQFFTFQVSRHGLVVRDAHVGLRFHKGKLQELVNFSFSEADDANLNFAANSVAFAFSANDANLQEKQGNWLRVVAQDNGYQLVPVSVWRGSSQGQDVVAEVNQIDGSLFAITPVKLMATPGTATAKVYERTPFNSQVVDAPLSFTQFTAGGAQVTTDANGNFEANQAGSIQGVKGKYASIRPVTGTSVSASATNTGDRWQLAVNATAEKSLAQANAYVHVNRIIARARNYISTSWFDRTLPVNVNLSDSCNAYWDGNSINFFSSSTQCDNTGLISDVVYHEWGHGLDANTGGIADGAYSEGFGDIVALVMTRDDNMGPGFFKGRGTGIRSLNNTKRYPQDRGEVHDEGLIIGGTFWDLYQNFKATMSDDEANDLLAKIAFKTSFTAVRYTDVYRAALVVDDNDGNTSTPSPHFCEINKAFAKHGLATADSSCR